MYTVNLNNIRLTQELPDKHFENDDEYLLIDEVSKYIKENHPDSFPNPVTLDRKIGEALKDGEVLTRDEAIARRGEEIMAEVKNETELRKAKSAPVREKFEKLIVESKEKFDIERKTLLEEHWAAKTEEEREAVQEKIDNNQYLAQQDFERLLKEQSEAVRLAEEN